MRFETAKCGLTPLLPPCSLYHLIFYAACHSTWLRGLDLASCSRLTSFENDSKPFLSMSPARIFLIATFSAPIEPM